MAGQTTKYVVGGLGLGLSSAKAVVCKTEVNVEKMVGEINKYSAKLSCNEDGTPSIIDGCYVFIKDNGTSLSLNSNLIDIRIENQVVRVVADDNSVEEISLDCANSDGQSLLMLEEELVEEAEPGGRVPDEEAGPCEAWGDAPTRLLISMYCELMTRVKSREIRTFKIMWEKMSDMMMEQGYKFNAGQVSNRFKTLKRAYNKRKFDIQNKRMQKGRIRPFVRRCPYQMELDELFQKQAELFPESVPRDEETIARAQLLVSGGLDPSVFLDDDDQMQTYGDLDSLSYSTPMVEIVDHMDYGEPLSSGVQSEVPRRRVRPNPLEELRILRASTLERLNLMDEKRDLFHEEVLEELKHKNEMLEKLLELVTKETLH